MHGRGLRTPSHTFLQARAGLLFSTRKSSKVRVRGCETSQSNSSRALFLLLHGGVGSRWVKEFWGIGKGSESLRKAPAWRASDRLNSCPTRTSARCQASTNARCTCMSHRISLVARYKATSTIRDGEDSHSCVHACDCLSSAAHRLMVGEHADRRQDQVERLDI